MQVRPRPRKRGAGPTVPSACKGVCAISHSAKAVLRRRILVFLARWCAGDALCLLTVRRVTRHWLPGVVILALAGAVLVAGVLIAGAAAVRCRERWLDAPPRKISLFGVSSWLHTAFSYQLGSLYLLLPVLFALPVVVFCMGFRFAPMLAFAAGEILLAFAANALFRHIGHDPELQPPGRGPAP